MCAQNFILIRPDTQVYFIFYERVLFGVVHGQIIAYVLLNPTFACLGFFN